MNKAELKRHVQEELKRQPAVDETGIGVEVPEEGVVRLLGHTRTYSEKLAAENAAKRVAGLMAVVNNIDVRLVGKRDDTTLAENAVRALYLDADVPDERIKVVVNDGWLSLEGSVDSEYQKRAAEKAIRDLTGVRGVSNFINVVPRVRPTNITDKIRITFERDAQFEVGDVQVAIHDDRVTLTGTVESWQERADAERQAWAAPGVARVENLLNVETFAPVLI